MNAAVLAGGRGSRMNYRDKSTLLHEGKTFLEIIVSKLLAFDRIMVIANRDKSEYPSLKAEFHKDLLKDIGPMGGIYTALTHSSDHYVFITTCDMPLVTNKQIDLIRNAGDYDVVIPVYEDKYEMLFARYSRRCLRQIEKLIDEKRYKITGIFEDKSLLVKKIPVDKTFMEGLRNINTPTEYASLREI